MNESLSDTRTDKYNDDTKEYDQTVSLDGKVVSKLSTGTLSLKRSATTLQRS